MHRPGPLNLIRLTPAEEVRTSAVPHLSPDPSREQHPTHRPGRLTDPTHDISVPVTEIHLDDSPDGTPNAPVR